MTIHHDKMAYGKLASLREDLTQEQLDKMAEQLAGESEYDRMVRGEVYNPAEEQLVAMRKRARRLFYRYNNSEEDEQELRQALLHQLFGSHGENLYCEPPIRFDYGCNFHVGENFYSNFNLTVLDVAPVRVGKNCMFGPNVTIVTPVHPFLACDRNMRTGRDGKQFDYEYSKPITIGDNVWLASNVVVCGGVTIGHDSVIGAGSVVTRDIPAGVLAAGNPCRVIRPLSEKDKMQLPDRF